jgi:hypothetical protein
MPRVTVLRGLGHERCHYRPGLGFCCCKPCRAEVDRRVAAEGRDSYKLGERFAGCAYVNREAVFSDMWASSAWGEARGRSSILQALCTGFWNPEAPAKPWQRLMVKIRHGWLHGFDHPAIVYLWPKTSHRYVAASLIQWLGTNVGWAFLTEALRRCGYKLVPIKPEEE